MKTITAAQRLQLIGLLALAEMHSNKLDDIIKAVVTITGEPDGDTGHSADAVWDRGRRDTDELLKRLEITVEG